jgi:hypothetical protein
MIIETSLDGAKDDVFYDDATCDYGSDSNVTIFL